ncbi:facilitated trehalose transporter Tret1-like [Schistocerca serialis cubense]|uniref:facilitated trehalose transporter Tret1-like n=1 Tax=Schistocerca serialis cubense TaxID=2023355 RepID=UPI00214E777E|nr:facilitated trehalose transporter Tret1-like [Schistocerca serialis cubense]
MDHEDSRPDAPMLQNGAGAQAQLLASEKLGPVDAAAALALRLPPAAPHADDDGDDDAGGQRRPRWSSAGTRNQLLAASACLLLTAGCGFPIGFSAVMLPQLRHNDSVIHTNEDMESWIASVHSAATPLGALFSSYLSEKVGRRTALQLTALPFLVGWLLLAFAQSYPVVMVGRIVCGFAVGVTASPCQAFLGELSEVHIRGLLAGVPTLSYSMGILLVYALGAGLEWHVVAGTGPVLPLLAVVALCFIPRSPVWLVRQGRFDDAKKALAWFRGSTSETSKQVARELTELIERARSDDEQQASQTKGGCCKVFVMPQVYKPLLIVNLLNIMQIVSGTFLVIFYGVDIVVKSASSTGSQIKGETFSVAVAVVRMVFCVVGCCLLIWWTRRRMAMVSGVLSALSALALGVVCLLKEHRPASEPVPASEPMVIAALLLLYVATNTAGFFLLPVIAIGELLPARVRGVAGGYTFFIFNSGLFVATKVFPFLTDVIGIAGIFMAFGMASLLGTLLVYLIMPETKGRTLNEVEDYFAGDNFLWITRHKYQSVTPISPLPKA